MLCHLVRAPTATCQKRDRQNRDGHNRDSKNRDADEIG
jgi:hypothetical protein